MLDGILYIVIARFPLNRCPTSPPPPPSNLARALSLSLSHLTLQVHQRLLYEREGVGAEAEGNTSTVRNRGVPPLRVPWLRSGFASPISLISRVYLCHPAGNTHR